VRELVSVVEALLVIDMLNDFIDERGALYCGPAGRAILPHIAARLAEARRSGVPIIFIADRHLPDDREFDLFPPHCLTGTNGAAVCPELAPREGELIIAKRRYSAFFGTDLDLRLREIAVSEVTLVGVCTNICVYFTAADAKMLGYMVSVPGGEVASFDEEAHRFALTQMEKILGANVL
jgi:nicotinamidase/pyrazinamidase